MEAFPRPTRRVARYVRSRHFRRRAPRRAPDLGTERPQAISSWRQRPDSVVLVAEGDLQDDERGGFNQRRLRTSFYPAKRALDLRDAVVYDSFGGREYSDSPRAIHEELVRRGAPLEHLWVVRDEAFRVPENAVGLRHGSTGVLRSAGPSPLRRGERLLAELVPAQARPDLRADVARLPAEDERLLAGPTARRAPRLPSRAGPEAGELAVRRVAGPRQRRRFSSTPFPLDRSCSKRACPGRICCTVRTATGWPRM